MATLTAEQFGLMQDAIEGLLHMLVEDWTADAPVARNPWSSDERFAPLTPTSEVWNAIDQGRAVLSASRRWDTSWPETVTCACGRSWPGAVLRGIYRMWGWP